MHVTAMRANAKLTHAVMCLSPDSSHSDMSAPASERRIGTHDGTFHCDEALAVFMLGHTAEFRGCPVVRSRDPKVLDACAIVVDVGAVYEPARHRYDHHQRGFLETLDDKHTMKLSSAGLIYKHFGREVIRNLEPGIKQEDLEVTHDTHAHTQGASVRIPSAFLPLSLSLCPPSLCLSRDCNLTDP